MKSLFYCWRFNWLLLLEYVLTRDMVVQGRFIEPSNLSKLGCSWSNSVSLFLMFFLFSILELISRLYG
jgi:hypothetical protein